ncbi:hypothetical protein QT711_08595 [Sporosarcina saromensis]|uniref:Uncharacterized protein n=1 Tax=Sporosarcina saromensis TaxID=359365 RepID=A0ABU4GA86_9BACL|nr:hypothetical protein [Sporosarcina saromensis]MDW0113245.1 hypothetical protein [Sporosarcina saromensis]
MNSIDNFAYPIDNFTYPIEYVVNLIDNEGKQLLLELTPFKYPVLPRKPIMKCNLFPFLVQ